MTEYQASEIDIKLKVKEFISNNFVLADGIDSLKDNDSFLDNGIIDSTGVVELVAFIEETFEIQVEDEELIPDNLDSIINLTTFISMKQEDNTDG